MYVHRWGDVLYCKVVVHHYRDEIAQYGDVVAQYEDVLAKWEKCYSLKK